MSRGDVSVPPRLTAVAGPSTGATGWSSATHGSSMSHEEVEFCAEEELVTIVPAFRKDVPLALLGGQYGPFRPQARRCASLALRVLKAGVLKGSNARTRRRMRAPSRWRRSTAAQPRAQCAPVCVVAAAAGR
jgi:hypothetical protein